MKKSIFLGLAGSVLALAMMAPSAQALTSTDHSLIGDAAYITPGAGSSTQAVRLTSDNDPGYGGASFPVASGTTFADLGVLSTEYRFATGDSCGGGSPRFQVSVATGSSTSKNIFVYIGDAPNYTGCASGTWQSSGDLINASTTVDTSQLAGGTFYDTYASATDKYGMLPVLGVKLIADAGWMFGGTQIVDVDNTNINGLLYTYDATSSTGTTTPPTGTTTPPGRPTAFEQCMKSGWMNLLRMIFKNQGQCISWVNHSVRGHGEGHDTATTTGTTTMIHEDMKIKMDNGIGHGRGRDH